MKKKQAKTKKEIEINYRIKRIKDIAFSIDEDGAETTDKFRFNLAQDTKIDFKKNEFRLTLTFKLYSLKTNKVVISISTINLFEVLDLVSFKNIKNTDFPVDLPRNFIITVFGLSYTHTRALLSKNLEGTKFNELFLPVVDAGQTADKIFKYIPPAK